MRALTDPPQHSHNLLQLFSHLLVLLLKLPHLHLRNLQIVANLAQLPSTLSTLSWLLIQYLPLNYVRKVGLAQCRVAVVCKVEAVLASDCTVVTGNVPHGYVDQTGMLITLPRHQKSRPPLFLSRCLNTTTCKSTQTNARYSLQFRL
jgi:hypothetical protein